MTHSSPDSLSSCPLVLWPAKVVVYRIIHTFHRLTSSNLIKTGKHPEGWHEITKLRMQDSLLIETVFGKTPFKWWWEPYHEGGRHCNCVSRLLQHHLISPHHHLVGNLCLSQISFWSPPGGENTCFFKIKVFGHLCLLVVKLRLLSYRSPQLAKQSSQLLFESKINPRSISNGKWRVTLTS